MKLLLDAGANIDAQSVNGGTPIMRAIETSQKDVVKLLIDRGCVLAHLFLLLSLSPSLSPHLPSPPPHTHSLLSLTNTHTHTHTSLFSLSLSSLLPQYTFAYTLINRAKLTLENKNGDTALDVARNWGDDFIYAIMYAKVSSLPPVVDKKGMQ